MAETPDADEREMREAIEAQVQAVQLKLRDWPAHMAARYNAPVYLLGSTLHTPNARDVDIRIVLRDDDFKARFGQDAAGFEECPTQRWIDDVGKLAAAMSRITRLNLDVKVWPESKWADPYPKPLVLAAPSQRWFIYNAFNPKPDHLAADDPGETRR